MGKYLNPFGRYTGQQLPGRPHSPHPHDRSMSICCSTNHGGAIATFVVAEQRRQRRQIGQIAQPEVFEEARCRDKQTMIVERDQPALQQGAQGAVAAGAAHALDPGLTDGLAVGDDGQHLLRCRG
jgi:hypothetical protein